MKFLKPNSKDSIEYSIKTKLSSIERKYQLVEDLLMPSGLFNLLIVFNYILPWTNDTAKLNSLIDKIGAWVFLDPHMLACYFIPSSLFAILIAMYKLEKQFKDDKRHPNEVKHE